jgi:hypothetical protein
MKRIQQQLHHASPIEAARLPVPIHHRRMRRRERRLKKKRKVLPMSDFLQRQLANVALAIELTALGAVVIVMVSFSLGAPATLAA